MSEQLFEYVPGNWHGKRQPGMKARVSRRANRDIVFDYEDGTQEVLSADVWCLVGPTIEAALPWWGQAVQHLAELTGRPQEAVAGRLRDLVYALQVDAGPARYNQPFSLRRELKDSLVEAATLVLRTMAYVTEMRDGK